MINRTEGVAKGRSILRWVAGGGVLAIAVLLVGLALAGGTAHAADDGVYTGTASVVEEGQCGGGTIAITVSGNTITSFIVDGSFAGGVPLNDFQLLPDITLTITDDVVSETFEPLPGVPTTLEATFSGDTFTGTLGVADLDCVGIGLSATLSAAGDAGDAGDTGAPVAGVGPIGGASGMTLWAVIAGGLAVFGLAVTGVGARIARKA
ncbi:MAG: hypothetical protein IH958_06585 [Chloroflexi bacterium]|nr:hypothetical protein [Chloroflexota bacterium]